jgi:hypothetical protein
LDQLRFNQEGMSMATETVERMGRLKSHTNEAEQHSEGVVARTIEEQTAKLPSDVFLWAAGASIFASLTLKMLGKHQDALFIGQWASPFLILGVYNKIIKVAGSDRATA